MADKSIREQREEYLLGVLRTAFVSAKFVEAFDDFTMFSIEFQDGTENGLTLHFDELEA